MLYQIRYSLDPVGFCLLFTFGVLVLMLLT